MAKQFTIKLNSTEKLEQLLQETYDHACKMVIEIQNEMNKLTNSCTLADVPIDEKVKYSKAIHDFMGDKKAAIAMKLEIAKFMGEIIKHNGDAGAALNDQGFQKATKLNLSELRKSINEVENTDAKRIKLKV